jgi:hypothetical protein
MMVVVAAMVVAVVMAVVPSHAGQRRAALALLEVPVASALQRIRSRAAAALRGIAVAGIDLRRGGRGDQKGERRDGGEEESHLHVHHLRGGLRPEQTLRPQACSINSACP